jgi:hypothetical protein
MKKLVLVLVLLLTIACLPVQAQVEGTWMRTDADAAGFALWFGGSNSFASKTWLHEIIYFPSSNYFEFEIGPTFTLAEGIDFVPMIGPLMNMNNSETDYLLPQAYLYVTKGKIYAELWNIYYQGTAAGTKDFPLFYGRYFFTYELSGGLAIGPHLEVTLDLADGAPESVTSMQFGLATSFPYGESNSMLLFLGAETKEPDPAVAGEFQMGFRARFSFVHSF